MYKLLYQPFDSLLDNLALALIAEISIKVYRDSLTAPLSHM